MTRNERKLVTALGNLVVATLNGEGVVEATQAAKAAQADIEAHQPPQGACIDWCDTCGHWSFFLDGTCAAHVLTKPTADVVHAARQLIFTNGA